MLDPYPYECTVVFHEQMFIILFKEVDMETWFIYYYYNGLIMSFNLCLV